MTDGVWWFFLFWLPKYLSAQYGMRGTDITVPLAVLYSMTMVGSVGGGWLPTYFINKGDTPYDGRMKAMLLIAVFPLVVLLAQPLGTISVWAPVLLIGIGTSAHQAWSANLFTTVSDMFPKKSVASVVGIGGMAGGLGGVLISKIGGWVFDYYGALGQIQTGYTIMFAGVRGSLPGRVVRDEGPGADRLGRSRAPGSEFQRTGCSQVSRQRSSRKAVQRRAERLFVFGRLAAAEGSDPKRNLLQKRAGSGPAAESILSRGLSPGVRSAGPDPALVGAAESSDERMQVATTPRWSTRPPTATGRSHFPPPLRRLVLAHARTHPACALPRLRRL